jgi:hypothetical protein
MGDNLPHGIILEIKDASMHLEMKVIREGLKVTDLKMPCIGVHSGR